MKIVYYKYSIANIAGKACAIWHIRTNNKESVGGCMKKGHAWALLPIVVFLALFIGYGIWTGGFYNMPAIAGSAGCNRYIDYFLCAYYGQRFQSTG